jgi:hypothetical protein
MDASPRLQLDRVREDETENGVEAWTRPMVAGAFDLAVRMSDAAGAAERRGCSTLPGRRNGGDV